RKQNKSKKSSREEEPFPPIEVSSSAVMTTPPFHVANVASSSGGNITISSPIYLSTIQQHLRIGLPSVIYGVLTTFA
ncbi:MAG: hypothetical protein ACKO7B_17885, partial [Flavobacteriales bacterium]